MPIFRISVVNEHFRSSNDHDCMSEEAARDYAIKGALAVAAEELVKGDPFFGAEIRIDEGDRPVTRFVISAGASPLKLEESNVVDFPKGRGPGG